MKRRAFTLIELLIVVAIISILAAIAVPNFLNAQVRAKVARVEAELEALSVAVEMYRLDSGLSNYSMRDECLTSPVAYISTIPDDPFPLMTHDFSAPNPKTTYQNQGHWPYFWYGFGRPIGGSIPDYSDVVGFNVFSVGPDSLVAAFDPRSGGVSLVIFEYAPTNGICSGGDINRQVGALIKERFSVEHREPYGWDFRIHAE
ncbi:MAG: prepilin-type N-terminal cleavage/methylation domain-containing protein [bacterium]